ncbi:ankyrin repeat domain-containing protein [Acetobacter farinalis]|uniref:Ankyrin repeat domain-containing protein n=1 Tax=Acetobacter farinalis TaxID=1260984 RepID=A0ABT3Q4E3_9PROT|nr:ankyrin repeat domain-containing protein [Acetobacter farinalis]MCX2560129.1 ankyrin repeat domain-containing protein [Acetobacter farinalis]NHO28784.1 ankyrin repeat domain-containing protein [Acetobacter farinalis]
MTRSFRFTPAALMVCGSLLFACATPVLAQSAREAEAQAAAEAAAQKAEAAKAMKRAAPPAAIPGAVEDDDENDHYNTDMEPTAALFDAINRGSLNSAKEAVNRGADLEHRNVLGQTPLDMSIDLNRNPITFLLLSLRGGDERPRTDVATQTREMDTESGSGHLTIGGTAGRHNAKSATASRFDHSGGTARPDVGFLGFGGS